MDSQLLFIHRARPATTLARSSGSKLRSKCCANSAAQQQAAADGDGRQQRRN